MEIERKWFVKTLPDLSGLTPVSYERYFLFIGDTVEVRIQKKGNKFEFERKSQISKLTREEQKFEITEEEYETFKLFSNKSLIRDSYIYQKDPEISIKVYKGDHEGLVRAEVEFESEDEAQRFIPLDWFGKEITESPIGRDKSLISLSNEEFNQIISEY